MNWAFFPLSKKPTQCALDIISVFEKNKDHIDSNTHESQVSDDVLRKLKHDLESIGFAVENGKKKTDKLTVPVLFGMNGTIEKSFDADALHLHEKFVLEVEAGRAVANYQFLKDIFQASMMLDIDYLGIAVRNTYKNSQDFKKVFTFLDTLYTSNRLNLPLKGILIIGY